MAGIRVGRGPVCISLRRAHHVCWTCARLCPPALASGLPVTVDHSVFNGMHVCTSSSQCDLRSSSHFGVPPTGLSPAGRDDGSRFPWSYHAPNPLPRTPGMLATCLPHTHSRCSALRRLTQKHHHSDKSRWGPLYRRLLYTVSLTTHLLHYYFLPKICSTSHRQCSSGLNLVPLIFLPTLPAPMALPWRFWAF